MKKIAIAVFVKTPGLSPIKTRLAADIGPKKAEEFYLFSIKSVSQLIEKSNKILNLIPFVAVAEKEGLSHPLWQKFQTMSSGEGGLGMRLHHVYSTLLASHDGVILIGSDAPQLSLACLEEVVQKIHAQTPPYIIGPAMDGGFYLFAGTKPCSEAFWTSIPYSVPETCSRLEERLIEQGNDFHLLGPLYDVDDLESLQKVQQSWDKDQPFYSVL